MGQIGLRELLIIALLVLLVFGAKRLPDTARALGKSMRILKSETRAMKSDDKPEQTAEPDPAAQATPARTIEAAPAAPAPPAAQAAPAAAQTAQTTATAPTRTADEKEPAQTTAP